MAISVRRVGRGGGEEKEKVNTCWVHNKRPKLRLSRAPYRFFYDGYAGSKLGLSHFFPLRLKSQGTTVPHALS
jgi:hypothetical protein